MSRQVGHCHDKTVMRFVKADLPRWRFADRTEHCRQRAPLLPVVIGPDGVGDAAPELATGDGQNGQDDFFQGAESRLPG